jgi:DNA-binding response OmpR family regulator
VVTGDIGVMRDLTEKKAIVVVEDNEAIAELIRDTLNAEPDYQAAIVHDGGLAVEAIRSVKASLILLDIELPGINGLQIYDILRADEVTRGIPILFVTSSPNLKEFEKRNIKDYIAKPFDLDELLANVAKVCRPGHDQD